MNREIEHLRFEIEEQEEIISDCESMLYDLELDDIYDGPEYDEWESQLDDAQHKLSLLKDELRIAEKSS
jgi:chromosome condensin MukBEF ATPase and DNA-binding subunit MukB